MMMMMMSVVSLEVKRDSWERKRKGKRQRERECAEGHGESRPRGPFFSSFVFSGVEKTEKMNTTRFEEKKTFLNLLLH